MPALHDAASEAKQRAMELGSVRNHCASLIRIPNYPM
jgi:hypothetical protein